MDDMTDVFDLHAADKTAQLDVIDCHLAEQRLKEAVTYTWKFGLQEYFDMSNVSKCTYLYTPPFFLDLIQFSTKNQICTVFVHSCVVQHSEYH